MPWYRQESATYTIQKKLKDNGSSPATIDTDENRAYFLIDIPCHPDFVEEDLSNVVPSSSQVVSKVENVDNNGFSQSLSKVLSKVLSRVEGTNFELVFEVFVALQNETSLVELMTMFEQTNRDRFKRTSLNILIQSGLATPTIPDKPNSSKQKYVLTEYGRQLIKDCSTK